MEMEAGESAVWLSRGWTVRWSGAAPGLLAPELADWVVQPTATIRAAAGNPSHARAPGTSKP